MVYGTYDGKKKETGEPQIIATHIEKLTGK